MRVLVEGSGGAAGWPQPGCRCASCLRAELDRNIRARATIVIDGVVRLGVGGAEDIGGGDTGNGAGNKGGRNGDVDTAGGGAGQGDTGSGGAGSESVGAGAYRIQELADARDQGKPGGWEVTGPDGRRLLYPARPGAVPEPAEGAAAYDIAFLDLLGEPAQLGLLRAQGLITSDTVTVVAFADHRVSAEGELRRRCGFWQAEVIGDGDAVTTARSEKKELTTERRPRRVLVLGGARSGKSERAEMRLAGEPDVTYVATGPAGATGSEEAAEPGGPTGAAEPGGPMGAAVSGGPTGAAGTAADREWAVRVAAHRARRPAWWRTAETTDLAGVLAGAQGALLIDGIGTWLAAAMDECGAWDGSADSAARLAARIAGLVGAWRQTRAYVVAVSDETGLGVVPVTPAGRRFRDELGRLNQVLAAESEEAELVVAGRIVPLAAS
jgi:adenosylcobinamide kinase / adenosylcobinamide-phosphate guanylyltransferase